MKKIKKEAMSYFSKDSDRWFDDVSGFSQDYFENFNVRLKEFPELIQLAKSIDTGKLKPDERGYSIFKDVVLNLKGRGYNSLVEFINNIDTGVYSDEFANMFGRGSLVEETFNLFKQAVLYYDTGIDMESKDTDTCIKRAFKASLEVDVEESRGGPRGGYAYESTSGRANNSESEWLVFENEKEAEIYAVDQVADQMSDEPELFSQDFLSDHIYVSDTDRRIIAGEESDFTVDDMDDDDVMDSREVSSSLKSKYNKSSDEDERMKLVDEAREELKSSIYDDVYKGLEDPIQYFVKDQGIYSLEDLLDQSFIQIDTAKAAKDAIGIDGIAHFLDYYDGSEEEIVDPITNKTFYAYGTN